ncbi:MAG: isocitrate lyase/phosphoenolpyruvate mutase family protein [Rhodoglobus sp.]
MTSQLDSSQFTKATLLDSLHVPGTPLIVTNVWDAVTARIVGAVPGVKALATASHAVSFAHGVDDGEALTVEQALDSARIIAHAVDLPVSVDFERGYGADAAAVQHNVEALIAAGAVGLNFEDSTGDPDAPLFPLDEQLGRLRAVRAAGEATGIPIVINARVDALVRGADWAEMVTRANAYLAAGANLVFVLGLRDEESVAKAIAAIDGRISVVSNPTSVPLKRLAELGVSRVSFGPGTLGLTLAHLQAAAAQLTALGDYPAELGFAY